MRRDVVIALAGGAVIVLASVGLVTTALREGPLDLDVTPVVVDAIGGGRYFAAGPTDLNGICLQPPCTARTEVELRFDSLPRVAYQAYLVGPGDRVAIPALDDTGPRPVFAYADDVDHTDKDRLQLVHAERVLVEIPVRPDQVITLNERFALQWGSAEGTFYATEIGGVSVSTVVAVELDSVAQDGWRYHAWFTGFGAPVDLGALETDGDVSVLDARVERLRLEDQNRFVVVLLADGVDASAHAGVPVGFPVAAVAL